jgi:hypothetical protein
MAVKVKSIVLWRKEMSNTPGQLAGVLEPLANAGADLEVLMGYRYPGDNTRAAVELYPVSGAKAKKAAKSAGLQASSIPALLVEGDNKRGVLARISAAIAAAGINIDFLVAQGGGRKFWAVLGLESSADAQKASTLIKKAAK